MRLRLVAKAGAVIGVAIGMWTLRVVAGIATAANDGREQLEGLLSSDGWVLGFGLVLSTVSVIACALVPASDGVVIRADDRREPRGHGRGEEDRRVRHAISGQQVPRRS
ncbi:MAG TPA: hypothetical protein VIP11_11365 [Gemmatimonadaceae bacterium]